jgi:hypothetical protein
MSTEGFFMKKCSNKTCSMEGILQPLDAFFSDKGRPDGKASQCKKCKMATTIKWRENNKAIYNSYAAKWRSRNPDKQHAADIKRLYGIPIEEYNRLLTEQACGCKICGKQHDPTAKRGRLYVDHDHTTGKIRGLLCGACNSALGYFEDKIEIMLKAIDYIKNSK